MTPEEFRDKMWRIALDFGHDLEAAYSKAEHLMCEVLENLGYQEGIDIYQNIGR